MNKRTFIGGGLALIGLTSLLYGCDPNKKGEQKTEGTDKTAETKTEQTPKPTAPTGGGGKYRIITNGISPFWDAMGKGVDAVKTETGLDADWQAPSKSEHNLQVALIKDAAAQQVAGIAVSPIEAEALSMVIDETMKSGIPVITFDSDAPKSKRLAYLGTNNYDAGRMAGEAAAKLFPNGGKLVAFVGNMGAQNARDRYQGFADAVKDKKIEFLQTPFEDNKDKQRAISNVNDAITKYGDKINGFVGLYSYNGPAIVTAVKQANLRSKVKVVCFDGEPATLQNIGEGNVDVMIVQKPFEFGRLSIKLLSEIKKANGDIKKAIEALKPELDRLGMKVKDGNIIDTGVTIVTPENAKAFLEDLKKKGQTST
ncbi:sugar ABC transporter substrate-binding protein [Armatimonadota bacterium]|nr:sugar ABC transporter substrate-binding protein [Armatimonadota bacterium]